MVIVWSIENSLSCLYVIRFPQYCPERKNMLVYVCVWPLVAYDTWTMVAFGGCDVEWDQVAQENRVVVVI